MFQGGNQGRATDNIRFPGGRRYCNVKLLVPGAALCYDKDGRIHRTKKGGAGMRKVTCYECEKRYDYDDDGFCPRFGAFNAPPSASRIAADGSVVWIDGLNERNHKNSFVHEELHDEDRERRRLKLDREVPRQVVRLDGAGKRACMARFLSGASGGV